MTRKNLLSKRIFSIILSLAVALSMMPVTAFAETSIVENAVAKVTMTASNGDMWTGEYTDLLDAFKAARKGDFGDSSVTSAERVEVKLLRSGETYTLQSDENFPISFEYGHSVTVDLNGCTLKRSVNASNQGILTVKRSANVTLKNGKLDLTVSTNNPKAINMPDDGGTPTLTLEEDMTINVTGTTYNDPFDGSDKSYTGTAIYAEGGNLNIKGGTYGEVQVHSATVKLSGGNYTEVEHIFGKYAEMLETGYIFAKQDDSSYIDPSDMGYHEVSGDCKNINNIKVIKCEHQDAPFTDGKCGHCGYICTKHTLKSGSCETCGRKLVANDGINCYVSLNEAFEQVANGIGISVMIDLPEETLTFNSNKEVTLTLSNHHVKGNADDAATLTVAGGKLTIINGVEGSTVVDDPAVITNNGKGFAVCVTGGTLKFDSKATITGGLQVIKNGKLEGGLKEGSILIAGTGNAMDGGSASSVSVRDSVNNQSFGVVRDLLGEGLAFAKYDKDTKTTGDIVSGNKSNLTEDVIVVEHTQHTIDKSTHKCACGWECDHPSDSVNGETGVCSQCDAQMAVAVTTGEGTSYSTNARDTVNNAPKDSTVKLYADTDESMRLYPNNSITLDANHHSIGDLYLNFTSVTVRNASVISNLKVMKNNNRAVLENCNVQSSLTTVVTIDGPLTMKGGSLQGYISMDNNGKLTFADGVTLKGSLRFWNGSNLITKLTQGTFLLNKDLQPYSISVEKSNKYTNVCELLADGYAFAKYNSATESATDEIVNGHVNKLTENVAIVPHTQHTFKNVSGEYVCDCGAKHEEHELDEDGKCMQCDYVCPHTNVNEETGKCNACQAAMVAKVTLGEATTYYTDVNKAITSAADGSTVTVISKERQQSVAQNTTVPANAAITLDLNGHTLSSYALKVDDESSKLTVKDSSGGNGRIGLSVWRGTLIFNPGNKKTTISQLNVYGGNVKIYGGRILGSDKTDFQLKNEVKMTDLLPVGYAYRLYSGESSYTPISYSNAAINDMSSWTSGYNLVPELCDHTKLESDFNEANCPYCNSTLAATVTKDSKTTGHTTAQKAIDNANGGTVKLLADVSGTLTISSALKLDCNGHTIEKLTVSEDVTLASLLPEGYAFKSKGTWVSDLSAKTLDNVTNAEAPIKSVTAVNSEENINYGESVTLKVKLEYPGDDSGFNLTWYCNDRYKNSSNITAMTKIYELGPLTPDSTGRKIYRLEFTKDGYRKSCEFTVTIGQKNIIEAMVGDIAEQTYNGNAQTPKVTVKDGETTLVKDKDYTVVYADNTNAGEATATITGIGNYTGQVVKKFTIKQKALSEVDITVADSGTYDGKAKTPEVAVKDGDKPLTEGTDYTLSYADNINAGENTAKVTVTGEGNYTGEVVKNFSIAKADYVNGNVCKGGNTFVYSNGGDTGNFSLSEFLAIGASYIKDKATMTKAKLGEDEKELLDGNISWSDDTNLSFKTKPCPAHYKATLTIPVNGGQNYNDYEVVFTIMVVEKSPVTVTINGLPEGMEYGKEFTLTATQDKEKTNQSEWTWEFDSEIFNKLSEKSENGTSITLKAIKATDVGSKITASYNGRDYKGSKSVTVDSIEKKTLNKADFVIPEPLTKVYDGTSKHTENVEISLNDSSKGQSSDTLTFIVTKDNIKYDNASAGKAAKATLTLPDISSNLNYKFADDFTTIVVDASITAKPITIASATATERTYAKDNSSVDVDVTFAGLVSDEILKKGTDYTVSGTMANANAGDNKNVNVTVTLKNSNYSLAKNTTTTKVDIAMANAIYTAPTVEILTYNGEDRELVEAGAVVGGKMVYSTEENGTYSETIPTGKDAGNYTVWYKVAGDENHNDTAPVSISVTIYQKNITDAEITLGNALEYSGEEQTQSITSVKINGLDVTYDISGNTGKDAKDYTLTVTGTGNFTGTTTTNWNIAKKNITNAVIMLGDVLTYTSSQQTQEIKSVKIGEMNVTYEVKDNSDTGKNAGKYTLTVTGKDNFTGTATKEFTIAQATVTTTDKPIQNTVYAGTEVSKVTFKENKVTVSFNNGTRELEGTWSVAAKDGATKFDKAGKYNCEATFTPSDKNFAPITIGDIEITVTNKPSGGGGGIAPIPPTTEVVTIDKVTTSPAEVKNETKTDADGNKETISKVTVSDANQKEIIKQVKDNKSEEIVINVSEKEAADNAKLDISLDKDFIDSIIKDTDASLTIKTPEGDKTFTQEELKKLTETAEGGKVTIDSSVFDEPTEPSGTLTPAQQKTVKGVKATKIILKSVRTKSGKIRLTWTKSKGYKVDYFEVYRSVKKNSGYGKKPFFTTKSGDVSKYLNTKNLKTGKTYYYKIRGVRVINGKKYYTEYSNKTWKKIK